MINAEKLVEEIRRELAPVEQEIRRHPYLAALETGRVRREDLTRFAGEQHHIIQSDLRSIALLVNFAAWGANCGRMGRALRDRYGLTEKATAFFDLFAAPPAEFEGQAMAVVAGGLARGVDPRLIKRAARLLQGYEKLYWDTLHALSGA